MSLLVNSFRNKQQAKARLEPELLVTAATGIQPLLLPIRGLIEKWILNPFGNCYLKEISCLSQGRCDTEPGKGCANQAAGIGTMKESAVQEEKPDASVFLQSLESICNLEENKNAVLFS